jgi:hypothetical protein
MNPKTAQMWVDFLRPQAAFIVKLLALQDDVNCVYEYPIDSLPV